MNSADTKGGKVLKATRKIYDVAVENRVIQCTIRGKVTIDDNQHTSVKVGDNVKVTLISDAKGVIEEILPRYSQLSRTIESRAYQEHITVANIDQVLIILSTKNPRFKSGLLDRYLVIAEKNHLEALVCINKIDLDSEEKYREYREYYTYRGYPVYLTSALTGQGIPELKAVMQNSVTALVGHSGVGKSSIIKTIRPELDIKIQSVSERTRKGIHTTTHVQLFPIGEGGFVVDTPGIRELGFWGIYKSDLPQYFREFRQYIPDCQFGDCTHIHEPGCAVKTAVEQGEILKERYRNYVNIYDSLKSAHYE
jgi:ribosome biogenesis GTPase